VQESAKIIIYLLSDFNAGVISPPPDTSKYHSLPFMVERVCGMNVLSRVGLPFAHISQRSGSCVVRKNSSGMSKPRLR